MCASENILVQSWCCTGYIMGAWKKWIHCCLNLEFLKTDLKKKIAFCSSCIPFRSIIRHLIREDLKPLFLTLSFPTFSFLIVVVLLFLQRKRLSSLWKFGGVDFCWRARGFTAPSLLSSSRKQAVTWVPNSAFQTYAELFHAPSY